jgi:hypothetical protein
VGKQAEQGKLQSPKWINLIIQNILATIIGNSIIGTVLSIAGIIDMTFLKWSLLLLGISIVLCVVWGLLSRRGFEKEQKIQKDLIDAIKDNTLARKGL